jgi:hypothetical protein
MEGKMPPSQDLKDFVWGLIKILQRRGIITVDEPKTAYCRACGKSHEFGWMIHKKTGDSFHLCEPIGKAVIDRQRDVGPMDPNKRQVIDWIDLFNQLI